MRRICSRRSSGTTGRRRTTTFPKIMQRDLIRLMHEPRIAYVSGGHLTTVLQAEKFIETIRAFLPSLGSNADRREWQ